MRTGSSPRVWGQVCAEPQFPVRRGIIPTRVGTRTLITIGEMQVKDHPHACGDKLNIYNNHLRCAGSSPRVWGQEMQKLFSDSKFRIIPTRVGTRSCFKASSLCAWDHPHACGDKYRSCQSLHHRLGSSPRVWGQEICEDSLNNKA